MGEPSGRVQRWLERVPTSDSPFRPTSGAFRSWDEWTRAGREIDAAEATLVDVMHNDPEPLKRAEAAMALGFVGGDAAVTPLIGILQNDAPQVAMEAASSLGRLGRTEALHPLCEALRDPDVNVRANAAMALGRLPSEKARSCLAEAANDPSELVRMAVQEALRVRRTDSSEKA